jgi:hypothetical protein
MLRCVEFERFRRFEHYRLTNLARVNLLVGDNNCGKTSLLEGICLHATGGAEWVLANLAWSRGEIVDDVNPSRRRRPHEALPQPTVSHFFWGHSLRHESAFEIRNCENDVKLEATALSNKYAEPEPWGIHIVYGSVMSAVMWSFPITEDGVLRNRLRRSSRAVAGAVENVQFFGPSARVGHTLAELWDETLKHQREAEVADILRILEPDLRNVVFLTSESAVRQGGPVGVFVGLKDQKERIPLASMGEGMYRLLRLALGLVQTSKGVLLVDEIDTGLHYSVSGDVWRLVVTAARQWDVQVFATTHSFDCVRGLAWLCDNYPDLASEVSLQKIDPRLGESVPLDAQHIRIAVDQGIEVR